MSATLREYLLKGIFLALWGYLALILPPKAPEWSRFGQIVGLTLGGLVLSLILGAVVQVRRGYRLSANLKAFPLVVLLESSFFIYIGVILGLALGMVLFVENRPDEPITGWLKYFVLGGAILGFGFHQLRQVKDRLWRFGFGAVIGCLLTYLAIHYLDVAIMPEVPSLLPDDTAKFNFAVVLLVGIPFFYLLTFCGEEEESEVEIAAICAALGIGLYLLGLRSGLDVYAGKLILLVPLMLYFIYATRILPGLRVFKHTLRGFSSLHLGEHLQSLVSFKRALRLDPKNELASQGMLSLHHQVDVTALPPDSPLLNQLDYGFCLDEAQRYLVGGHAPTPADRDKADRMLGLVERQCPKLSARVDYLRAVLLTHAKQFDSAAELLGQLLSPETVYDVGVRKGVLYPAWDLAVRLHPELVKRLGMSELAKPGRRMEAIAAVERELRKSPNDPSAQELKNLLYTSLTESEFLGDAASGTPDEFNYDYVEQLGLALLEQQDPERRDRGMAFLRIAGRGLPGRGPTIFKTLADVADSLGRPDEARGYREQIKRAGVLVGPKKLPDDQRALFYTTVRQLAADAENRGEIDSAIGDWRLVLEGGQQELSICKKLAELYEKNNDAMNALLMTETGLLYNSKDPDLLAKKDKYYYSVQPDRVQAVKEKVERFFDVDYCVQKATKILAQNEIDPDSLDWAYHLVQVAKVIQPKSAAVRFLDSRCLLRKGERDTAVAELEKIREEKPSSADEEAWYDATRLAGHLYLNELNRPDLAVKCFLDYRSYSKSGADTLFNLAKSYEAMGDIPNAVRFYDAVTVYDQHPKYWEAKEKASQLKASR